MPGRIPLRIPAKRTPNRLSWPSRLRLEIGDLEIFFPASLFNAQEALGSSRLKFGCESSRLSEQKFIISEEDYYGKTTTLNQQRDLQIPVCLPVRTQPKP
mmetsp:Transcript_39977/g.96459  ORF Transcript_39977/g.96459 Transcript_39977/m.96459 type:complete len:100 (-) Transcript_39977:19-318(-)